MRNKKLSNILKISILTLLIILGTVGSARAGYQTYDNGFYPQAEFPGESYWPGDGNVGFDTLDNHQGILCNEHGKELNSQHKLGQPGVYKYGDLSDVIANGTSKYPVGSFSTYNYSTETSVSADSTSQKILFIIARAGEGGLSHYSRWAQWQVWNMGGLPAGGSTTANISTVLGALDFEKANNPFSELYNFNNLLGAGNSGLPLPNAQYLKGVLSEEVYNELGLTSDDETFINSLDADDFFGLFNALKSVDPSDSHAEICGKIVDKLKGELYLQNSDDIIVQAEEMGATLTDDEKNAIKAFTPEIQSIEVLWQRLNENAISSISAERQNELAALLQGSLLDLYKTTYGLTDDQLEGFEDFLNGMANENIKNLTEVANTISATNNYQEFAANHLIISNGNQSGTLKQEDEPKIDDTRVTAKYDEEMRAWIVGPLSVTYVDVHDDEGYKIAGLSGITLEGKSTESDTPIGLTYNPTGDINHLAQTEYTIVDTNFAHFDNYGTGLPTSASDFYIVIGFNEKLEKVSKFGFRYSYVVATATTPQSYTIHAQGNYSQIIGYKTHIENVTVKSALTFRRWETFDYWYRYEDVDEWSRLAWHSEKKANMETCTPDPVTFDIDPVDGDIARDPEAIKAVIRNNFDKFSSVTKTPAGYKNGADSEIIREYPASNYSPTGGAALRYEIRAYDMQIDGAADPGGFYIIDLSSANIYLEPIVQEVTWSDAQDLIQLGGAKIVKHDIDTEINVPWTVDITVEKGIIDENGEDVSDDDQLFYFEIATELDPVDGKVNESSVKQKTVKLGDSTTFKLSSDVAYGDYYIIETDENFLPYYDWVQKGKPTDSLWNKYKPQDGVDQAHPGTYKKNSDKFYHITNVKTPHEVPIKVYKKVSHGRANDSDRFYFDVKVFKNDEDLASYSKHFYITTAGENGGDSVTVETSQEGDYDIISATLPSFKWYGEDTYRIEIKEVDKDGRTYSEFVQEFAKELEEGEEINVESTWEKFEVASEEKTNGTLVDGETYEATIVNKPTGVSVDVNLLKTNSESIESKDPVILYVAIDQWYKSDNGNWVVMPLNNQTIDIQTNGAPEEYKYKLNNPDKDSYYLLRISEKQSDDYEWKYFDVTEGDSEKLEMDTDSGMLIEAIKEENKGKWIIHNDPNSDKIISATKVLNIEDGAKNKFSVTIDNGDTDKKYFTGIRIDKEVVNQNSRNDKFYFKVGTTKNGVFTDYTSQFFFRDHGEADYNTDYDYIVVDFDSGYKKDSYVIEWPFSTSSETLTLKEVDQYGVEYPGEAKLDTLVGDEGENGHSIWYDFAPLEADANSTILLNKEDYKTPQAAIDALNEGKLTLKGQNARKYQGKIQIEKYLTEPAEEDNVFYFRIESYKDTFENINSTKTPYDYFDSKDVTILNGATLVKLVVNKGDKYASVESNYISWTSNMEGPEMTITEVDQYNQAYPGSSTNIEHADSIWHKYYPIRLENVDKNTYPDGINSQKDSTLGSVDGTYLCQIVPDTENPKDCKVTVDFVNKPNAATGAIWLTKLVINPETGLQEKPQDDEIFGYRLEFTSNKGREIPTIERIELNANNNWNYFKDFDFELAEGENITVRATEIDENNESYAPGKEYEAGTLWTKFRPTYNHEKNGGYGVAIAEVKWNGSEHVWATLTGLNENAPRPVEHKLKIQKFVNGKAITNDDKFYFRVMDNNNSKEVTKDLFGTEYVVLDKDNQSKESKTIITKETESYTYTIIEVDSKGLSWQEYLYKKASNEYQGITETISDFWETKYVPEDTNPVWQVTINKDSPETVVVKAYNDENVQPDYVGLAISKSLVDLEDNSLTTLKQDSPEFKFKVYLKNYTNRYVVVHTPGEDRGSWTSTAIEELDNKSPEYGNGYRGVIEASIKVEAGNVSSFIEIYGIEIKAGSTLEYKIVEEADTSSYKFADVEAPEGMVAAKNGVYEGSLKAGENTGFETVAFYNAFRKVKLNLEKLVYDENGEQVPIEPGEKFVFEVVYNDDETTKQTAEIDHDNPTWKDEIELGIDDELKYTITETAAYVDGNYDDNVLGTVFVPVNDKAEITGTIGKDVIGSLNLQGENALIPYTVLPIEKIISEESTTMLDGNESFYFKVTSEDGKQDYTELFGGQKAKDSSDEENNYVIKVSADEKGRYRWLSAETPWVGLNNEIENSKIKDWLTKEHKVKVVEVDQWGDEYPADGDLSNLNENSVWNNFKPVRVIPETYTLSIYGNLRTAKYARENILTTIQKARYLGNTLAVKVENAQKLTGHITVGKTVVGTADPDDNFYFKITKLNGSEANYEWLKDDLVKEYFKDAATTTSKGDNKTQLLVLKAGETVESSDIEWYSNEHRPQFILSEVDQYGEMWTGDESDITHKDSTWFKYQPVDKKWASTVTAQLIAGANYEFGYEFDELFENKLEDRHLNISKVVENGEFDGPYYFKVSEITTGNGQSFSKDVTSELFDVNENGYLEITTEDSVRSNNIFGTHKYVITEYDENGKSYSDFKNGKASDFWSTRYVPANLDSTTPGSWTVTVNKENPEVNFIAKNLKWVTGLEVRKDAEDAEEDEEFYGTLNIISNKYTKGIYVKDAETNKVSGPLDSKTYPITFKKNSPFVLEDCITWVGEAPIWYVNEITDNTGWKLEGYKVNGAQEYSENNGTVLKADPSENENIIVVKNTKLENVSLKITKERRNTTDNRAIIDQSKDYTYDVEIYLKNYEDNYCTLVHGMGDESEISAERAEIKNISETDAKYGEGYTGYIKTTVTVKAGKTIGTTFVNNIVVEAGKDLGYKIVEVDKDGYSYEDKDKSTDTLWNKTKPTIENKEGTVSSKQAENGISKDVTIKNMYKIIHLSLSKIVDNGPIQKGEKFYYDAKITSSNGNVDEAYVITLEYDEKHEKDHWAKEFVLDLDETLSYELVEIDENSLSYTDWIEKGQPESEMWSTFKPIDDGKISDTIETDKDLSRPLNGYNEFIPYTFLPIEKIISDESDPIISENTKFYFKVKSVKGDKDYTELFSNVDAQKAENGKVIEVSKNGRNDFRAVTNVTKWEEKSNAVIIVEVDQYGDTEAIEADSIWNEYKCLKNEVAYELLKFDSKDDAEKAHDATAKYLAKQKLTVEERAEIIDLKDFAEIENAQKLKGHIEITKHVEGTPDEDDKFYFTISKLNGSEANYEWFNEKVIETYFSGYETTEVDGKTLLVLKAEETATSSDIEWYSNEHRPQFVISEVDQYGQMWTGDIKDITNELSIWHKYQPVLSKFPSTVTAQLIAGKNYEYKYEFGETFNNQKVAPKNLTLLKKIEDGNFDGPYYFKVTENGDEVKDLFTVNADGYIEINSENGITSADKYGTHKYVITEYAKEGNEYVSYAEYKAGKASTFWSTRYIPDSEGVWEVELNVSKKFTLKNTQIHSAGFRILKEVVNESEEEVGTHKDTTFEVVYKIIASQGTKSLLFRNENGILEESTGIIKTVTISENKPFEDYKYEANKDNYIVWTGDAPTITVEEIGKADWKLVGFKKLSDGENSEFKVDNTFTLEDNAENAIVVGNENITHPEEVKFQIEKTVVNLKGIETKLYQDSPEFYFDIYIDDLKDFENPNYTLESAEGKPYAVDNETGMTYKYYVRVPIIVKAGTTSKQVTVDGFEITKGSTLNYKIVEADKNGYSYDDRNKSNDDLWNKTRPTIFSDGKSGNIKGIWTGKLDKSTPVSNAAKIAAYNIIRQVKLVFTKDVIDENGNKVGIQSGEIFHFNIDYTNHNEEDKSKDITYTDKTIIETITLELEEKEHVIITEVDGSGDTYQNRKEGSDTWEKFAPENGTGIFERDIDEDVDGSITLFGTNIESENTLYGRLSLGKLVINEEKTNKNTQFVDNEFYFVVEDASKTNVVDKLFTDYAQMKINDNDSINVVILKPGDSIASKVVSWKEGAEAPSYAVYEVDQYGQTYSYFENAENDENRVIKGKRGDTSDDRGESIWNKFKPNHPKGVSYTLKGKYTEAELSDKENWTNYHYTNTVLPNFWALTIQKEQDGGKIQEGEHFYVEIAKDKPEAENVLDLEALEALFPNAKTADSEAEKDIVKLGSGKYAIHLYKDHDEVTSAQVLDERDTYWVVEVDKDGNTIEKANKTDKDAIFKRFTIADSKDGKFEVNSKDNVVIIDNISEDKATVKVSKQLQPGQSSDEIFRFSIQVQEDEVDAEGKVVKDEKGNVVKTFVNKDLRYDEESGKYIVGDTVEDGYTVFELKANEVSPEIEFSWRKDQDKPVIKVLEYGRTPSAIYVNNDKYDPDTLPAITLDKDHTYTYVFENNVKKSGNIQITKKYPDDVPENPNGMPKYKFYYEYYILDANGNEVNNSRTRHEITVEAGKTETTNTIEWNQDQTAHFEVWEVDKTPDKVLVDGAEVDPKNVIGTVTAANDHSVEVVFVNNEWENGGIHSIKAIKAQKAGGLDSAISTLPEDYAMNFTLTIKPGTNSMFIYNGKTYSDSNSDILTVNKSISKNELEKYKNSSEDGQYMEISIFDIPKTAIKWPKGFAAPEYSVVETPDNHFIQTEGTLQNSGSLSNDTVIFTKITNLREEVHWDLVITEMSGIVWEDIDEKNKVGENAAGGHDGKYNEMDKLIPDGVYVKLARVYYLLDENGNLVEKDRMYNGERMRIAKEDGKGGLVADSEGQNLTFMSNKETIEYQGKKYIVPKEFVEVKDGKYSFGNVLVPAFTEREVENGFDTNLGWRVRYDVEFYYDGIKYEPTDLVAGSNGNVYDYISNPNDPKFIGDADNNYYGGNSFATEDEASRLEFSKNHAKVENVSPMDSKGHSVGKIGSATIEYDMVNELEANGRTIVQSQGTIDLNTNGNDMDSNGMTVKATTANSGIVYMLTTDKYLYIDLSAADEVTSFGIDVKQPDVEYSPSTVVTVNKYKHIYEYANHINLGLVNRSQAATTLEKNIDTAKLIINQKVYTYEFNPGESTFNLNKLSSSDRKEIVDYLTQVVENDNRKLKDEKGNETDGNVNVYQSDYYYRAVKMYSGTDVYEALDRFYTAIHKENSADPQAQNLSNMVNSLNLQVYLTYRISLTNCSADYDVEVHDIDDYSESSLKYVDVRSGYLADAAGGEAKLGSGLYAYIGDKNSQNGAPVLTNVLDNEKVTNSFTNVEYANDTKKGISVTIDGKNVRFNKNTIVPEEKIILAPGENKTFYTTYKVTGELATDGTNILLGEKRNIAEIKSFTAYVHGKTYKDENNEEHRVPAAVIDIASAPGNYNLSNTTYKLTEADTDIAKTNLGMYIKEPIRTIQGTAWLDKNHDGYYVENEDALLSGIHAELVEVMDVPVYNENLELLGDADGNALYTEYDFYMKDDAATTNSDGKYIFDTTSIDGVPLEGLLPGNYEVRFFYGDNANVRIEGETISDKLPRINGIDYKTTTYRAGSSDRFLDSSQYINNEWYKDFTSNEDDEAARNKETRDNEARDNEARRLALIQENQHLNNANTSIFDAADYANADDYAKAKLRGLENEVGKLNTLDVEDLTLKYKSAYNNYLGKMFNGINLPERNGSIAYSGVLEGSSDGDYTMFADTAKIVLDQTAENRENIDLGLEQRKEAKVILDKQIKEITFVKEGEKIFHAKYDIFYGTTPDFKDGAHLVYSEGDNNIYVAMVLDKTSVINDDILLAADDILENGRITQGFRYINVDSQYLHGLQVNIQYQITAINIGEDDYMGEGLDHIVSEDSEQKQKEAFENAILAIASPDYTINATQDRLMMFTDNDTFKGKAKPYGYYLGHIYYEGAVKDGDKVVNITVTKVVDYVDNDIKFASDTVDENNNQRWNLSGNTDALNKFIDQTVLKDGKIYNELELPYNDGHIAMTSSTDTEFSHPLTTWTRDNGDGSSQAITYITLADTKTGTDMGDYGVDNYAEIIEVFNPIATRDRTSVYGNYDPRLGASGTVEGDETATELITLSPPTGNEDNERTMAIVIGTIVVIAVLAGAGTGLGLKISTKKSKKDEE